MSTVSRLSRAHPLWTACLLVAVGAGTGYAVASVSSGKPQEALFVASTTLVFGALLGGVVKFLLEDLQRLRERRAENARFVKQMLDDLKSVYDRVERARILIRAQESALTYGNEMRDLINSAVQLRNISRAIDTTSDVLMEYREKLRRAIRQMTDYVDSLTDEFRDEYKEISDEQSAYEANAEQARESRKPLPSNKAWHDMRQLKRLAEFLGLNSRSPVHYKSDFEDMLDAATWILRAELKRLGDGSKLTMPSEYDNILEAIMLGELREGCAEIGDQRLHYVEAGEGPLIVLLHGFPEFWYGWRQQIQPLAAAGFRVVAPDMRGYNLSLKPEGVAAYDTGQLAADIRGLIHERSAKTALLVGHDWGGTVAWATAMNHPEVVDRLAILNAAHPRKLLQGLRHPGQLRKSWYFFFFNLPRSEPVKLNETSGSWFCLCGLLGLDGGAGLVDPGLAGQLGRDRVPSAEPVRAGRVGGIEDLLAAGPDGPGGAVVD
jgi:pimeloyl-ACP methyl ester carboxylesterase